MFGHPVTGRDGLLAALDVYAQQAAVRLRRQHALTRLVGAFAATSPFHDDYRSVWVWAHPTDPTDDPITIIRTVNEALSPRLNDDIRWVRGGILLTDLTDRDAYHTFNGLDPTVDHGLARTLDRINHKYGIMHAGIGYAGIRGIGRHTLEPGADWWTRRERLSNRGTTRWDELITVKAM